jgi:hypothetical protein
MNRWIFGLGAVLVAWMSSAQPVACPSVQWTIGQPAPQPQSQSIRSSVAVDYDGDGKLDLVGTRLTNSVNDLVWWKGAGDRTFGAPAILATAERLSNVVLADATGDGRDDIVAGLTWANKLLILPGTGSGFGPAIETSLTIAPQLIFAGNRDADPAAELVVSSFGSIAAYDDIATTPVATATLQTSYFAAGVASADFDGDGYFDLAVAMYFKPSVALYYGKADGTYEPPVQLPALSPWSLALGDLNEDGKVDLVAGNQPQEYGVEGSVSIHLNQGARAFASSTFSLDRPRSIVAEVRSFVLADVSDDGHLDLVAGVTNNGGWTTTATGRGDGTFRTPTYQITDTTSVNTLEPTDLTAADFDGDGKVDLAINVGTVFPASRSCATQTDLLTVSPVISTGQPAALNAHVSGFDADTPVPRGTLTLRDGTTFLASAPVAADGTASFSQAGLAVGQHTLTAQFSGNAAVPAATSAAVIQTVTNARTQLTIGLPAATAVYGDAFPVQLAFVNDTTGPFNDVAVVDVDGIKSERSSWLSFDPWPEPGHHVVSARYFGSPWNPPSEAAPVSFDVSKAPSTLHVTGALAVREGSPHALTVSVQLIHSTWAEGSVQVLEGSTTVATGTLHSGLVAINHPFTRGAHDLTINYAGDDRYLAATQHVTIQVLPLLPLVIEARGLPGGVHIAYVLPVDPPVHSPQLMRRQAGTAEWVQVAGWNPSTGMDPADLPRGVAYEYQLVALLEDGSPMLSNIDSALLFDDDLLATGIAVKRAHFSELRTAVNLLRAEASLPPFEFEPGYDTSALVRAAHLTGLRTAVTEARQQLGMTTPSFTPVTAGTTIRASQIQELRELAR